MKQTRVPITSIYTDPAYMVRAMLNQEVIDEYCEAYLVDQDLPPLNVFKQSSGKYLVADGWHRYEAAKQAKLKTLPVKVFKGERERVIAVALEGNKSHGLRRTNEDKRICGEMAIETWPLLSNSKVAEIAGVSESLIRQLRAKCDAPVPEKRVGMDGKDYPAKISRVVLNEPDNAETPEKPHISQPTIENSPRGTTPPKPADPTDETGFKLTETALKSWAHRDRVQSWLTALTKIKSEFESLQKDPLFIRQNQQIVAHLKSCYSTISDCKPYAVCTECSGNPEKQSGKFCTYCGTSGVISKYNYDLQSRSSVKEIREKAAKRV